MMGLNQVALELPTPSFNEQYGKDQITGLAILVGAAGISGFAVWIALFTIILRSSQYQNTHVVAFLCSLLVSNLLQAAGTAMNAKWALQRLTEEGGFCRLQAGLKQAGNVGMALWTFTLSAHLFTLLFLRWRHTKLGSYLTLATGWLFVVFIVVLGPIGLEDKRGNYFAPTGLWCWISNAYPHEQLWMEYFWELLSAGLSTIIYSIIILRVRGNLYVSGGRWHVRFVPRGESWQLNMQRDLIDTSMLRVAAHMVWFPVTYTVLLLPMAICQFLKMYNIAVPFWGIIVMDTFFNLQGFFNILLLLITSRAIPDLTTLPDLSAPRKSVDMSPKGRYGITPFILPPKTPDDPEKGLTRTGSNTSSSSADSTSPLVLPVKPKAQRWSLASLRLTRS
ncbi:hypothetical protein BXZ70DRAFT_944134 [Cristinia sonorae]|uniref:Glucose receptor Git3 N-terminal domain-containing protein n=1 Tax=Cristinia sonorae TaxID=1940300 RepID=A0A8K0XP62_9AGAR|nr:hypothetical protein BXZ70DRAFT_944134 [Cristinia sonorae]